jgi:hypothetical protein
LAALAGWTVPAGGLLLVPKCPACLAVYIAVISGAGISVSAAAWLRMLLIAVFATALAYFAAKAGWLLLTPGPARVHRKINRWIRDGLPTNNL